MNKILPEVITDILTYNGAIVEQADNGVLDIIFTTELSEYLFSAYSAINVLCTGNGAVAIEIKRHNLFSHQTGGSEPDGARGRMNGSFEQSKLTNRSWAGRCC